MDQGTRKFLWLITNVLGHCDLQDPGERRELLEISRRLKQLAGRVPDELSCQRLEEVRACSRRKADVEARTWSKEN